MFTVAAHSAHALETVDANAPATSAGTWAATIGPRISGASGRPITLPPIAVTELMTTPFSVAVATQLVIAC